MKQAWIVSRVGPHGVEVCGVYSDQEKARAALGPGCAAAMFMVDTDATDQRSFAMITRERPELRIVTPETAN